MLQARNSREKRRQPPQLTFGRFCFLIPPKLFQLCWPSVQIMFWSQRSRPRGLVEYYLLPRFLDRVIYWVPIMIVGINETYRDRYGTRDFGSGVRARLDINVTMNGVLGTRMGMIMPSLTTNFSWPGSKLDRMARA